MGGDHAPANVVAGAIDALAETRSRFTLLLVGKEELIKNELATHPSTGAVRNAFEIVNAREVIEFEDDATAVVKKKKDSSLSVGASLHRDGKADAFVSAGHTGAMLSAGIFILGRMKGVGRPTIGALVPTAAQTPTLLVDAGTSVDCKPRHLFEFGVMGAMYVEAMVGKASPSIGLLSIGEEENKGNEVTLEAFAMFKQSTLNFFGNVEGRDILKGKVDVVVCDGFVGNILLKFGESVPSFFKAKFTSFAEKSFLNKLAALVARNGMRSVMKELDYQEHGGVPLLGVNGVSIIGHGGSTPKAIKNMIFRAEEMVQRKVNDKIRAAMAQYAS
jgi:glycerol-3-phosphate acyltransferase PlsX